MASRNILGNDTGDMNIALFFVVGGIILAALSYVWPQLHPIGTIFLGVALLVGSRVV